MRLSHHIVATFSFVLAGNASAFVPHSPRPASDAAARVASVFVAGEYSSTALFRGAKNAKKQMELAKKMAMAKQQKQRAAEEAEGGGSSDSESAASSSASAGMSDDEIKAENDRKRFDELLNSERATAMFEFNSESGYLTREQEEEAATAGASRGGRVDRLFELDSAPTTPFEDIVNIHTENALGEGGAKNLVPWLHKNTARHKDYLVVITDPREKSSELRQAVASLCKSLPKPILSKTIIITADAPPENRRWLKKNKLEDDATIFSDEKREWMREYTALGEKRWSMTCFVLGDGKIQKLVRELDQDLAPTVVRNAVKSLDF